MSQDIRDLLERMTTIEQGSTTPVTVKSGLNAQQRRADQLPALFRPHHIDVLNNPTDPQHPMKGRAVGSLEERMGEIEEDMVGKIRRDLNDYLRDIEQRVHDDGRREKPHLQDIQKRDTQDRDLVDKAKDAVDRGQAEESEDLAETIALEDGSILTIHGSPATGFGIRRGGRKMSSRFDNIDDARMAVDLFRARRREQQPNPDYMEER
jgi:hypothetical protein